jgi:hypothetical protein
MVKHVLVIGETSYWHTQKVEVIQFDLFKAVG